MDFNMDVAEMFRIGCRTSTAQKLKRLRLIRLVVLPMCISGVRSLSVQYAVGSRYAITFILARVIVDSRIQLK